jgi:hypothetical protein
MSLNNKALKLEALIAAVECLNSGKVVRTTSPIIKGPEDNAMEVENMDPGEDMEDGDTDMD